MVTTVDEEQELKKAILDCLKDRKKISIHTLIEMLHDQGLPNDGKSDDKIFPILDKLHQTRRIKMGRDGIKRTKIVKPL